MFGERLKMLRTKNGLTKKMLWEFMGFDSKPSEQIRKWESGEMMPDCCNLVKLADVFRVSTDFLLGRDDVRGNNG